MSASSQAFTAAKKSYYDILGVSKTADEAEIKKAFRKKSLLLHPDRNKAEEARAQMNELVDAYEVLKDSEKRLHYDASLNPSRGFSLFDLIASLPTRPDIPDPIFTRILEHNAEQKKFFSVIFMNFDKHVKSPEVILVDLLKTYQSLPESILPLFGNKLSNKPFANMLISKLSEESFSAVAKLITPEVMNTSDAEFLALWSAFFSVYPNFVYDIDSDEIRQKIKFKSVDELMYEHIFNREAKKIMAHQHKPEHINLLALTGHLDVQIATCSQKAFPDNTLPRYERITDCYWDSLTLLVQRSNAVLSVEFCEKVLSHSLQDLEFERNNIFEFIKACIHLIDPNFIATKLRPFFLKQLLCDNIIEINNILNLLPSIQQYFTAEDFEKVIFPVYKQVLTSRNTHFQVSDLTSLLALVHLMPDAMLSDTLLPILLKGVESLQSCKVTLNILNKLRKDNASELRQSVIHGVEEEIQLQITEGLADLDQKIFLTGQVNEKTLQKIMKGLESGSESYRTDHALAAVSVINDLSADKFSREQKENLLHLFIDKMQSTSQPIPCVLAACYLIDHTDKLPTLRLLLDKIISISNPKLDKNINYKSLVYDALLRVCKRVPNELITKEGFLQLLEFNKEFSRDQNIFQSLLVILQKCDPTFTKTQILPKISGERFWHDDSASIINTILPMLNYNELAYFRHFLLRRMTVQETLLNNEVFVLQEIYAINKKMLVERKELAVEKSYEAVRYEG